MPKGAPVRHACAVSSGRLDGGAASRIAVMFAQLAVVPIEQRSTDDPAHIDILIEKDLSPRQSGRRRKPNFVSRFNLIR